MYWLRIEENAVSTPSFSFFLGLVSFLSTMLENPGELIIIEHAIFYWSFPVHFVDIIIRESVPYSCKKFPESILMDEATVLLVKASEGIFYHFFWVSAL